MAMEHIKYPRTPHLPQSRGITDDDEVLSETQVRQYFSNEELVWTEKMDGENITIYPDGSFHSRSLTAHHKPYHSYLQNAIIPPLIEKLGELEGELKDLSNGMRICGEYLYARHGVSYDDLKSFFLVFSIWHEDLCLPWNLTELLCRKWELQTVPILAIAPYDEHFLRKLIDETEQGTREGFVIRPTNAFLRSFFDMNVAKYVRANRPVTPSDWSGREHNSLRETGF